MLYLYLILILILIIIVLILPQKRGKVIYLNKQQVEKEERKKQILELIKENGKITNDKIQKKFKVSDATATNYLQELENERKIKQVGKIGRFVYYKKI